jgi:hypothetical protein
MYVKAVERHPCLSNYKAHFSHLVNLIEVPLDLCKYDGKNLTGTTGTTILLMWTGPPLHVNFLMSLKSLVRF